MRIKLYDLDTQKTLIFCTVRNEAEAQSVGQSWIEFYKKYKRIENVAWDYTDEQPIATLPVSAGQAFGAFFCD